MYPQALALTMKAPGTIDSKHRPIAKFHPSIWNDHFLSLCPQALKVDDKMEERAAQLKNEVRQMQIDAVGNPLEKLTLVDSIQRLGISYHFENDIDQVLEKIYKTYNKLLDKDSDEDLNVVALLFRLLRQQGYRISCDIFRKFTESNGKFKDSLVSDPRGILNLYEAAHVRVHGENLLEEALEFTTKHLKVLVADSSHWLADEAASSLKCPLWQALPRVKARQYMPIYQQDPSHNDILLTFSKLDFNILQKYHQKELNAITRWWKDLDVATNFPFARDRVAELYYCALGVYFEPKFSLGREILTKLMAMVSILDDIYDAYGTFEELQVFTAAIQRWDINTVDMLPEYMKFYYKVLLDLFDEIDKEIGKDGSSYNIIQFTKEAMRKLAKCYIIEAQWLNKRYKPTFREYMEIALDTSDYSQLAIVSFIGMGDMVTKDVFEWFCKAPKIIEASRFIGRLLDDIGGHEFEQEREHVVSAIECYMEQYGCSKEEAYVEFNKQVVDAWKDINEACLHPMDVGKPILIRVLNFARFIYLFYKDGDGYTHAKGRTEILIKSMLVDPLPN